MALLGISHATPARAQNATADKQSCRAFVQSFYDWYWNQFADRADNPKFDVTSLHRLDEALKRKPPVLTPALLKLVVRDQKGSRALDFDPFLNNQNPQGRYTVADVAVVDDQCRASLDHGHVVADLTRFGTNWLFANFHYSYFYADGRKRDLPDTDLVHILTF